MTSEMNEKAQEIIESIAKLPCARPFLTPVSPDDESTRTYYRKIKEPIDLSLIKMRILLKKYQYVSELQSDMNLILKNSKTFNGPSHFITQLAEILIKNFEKMFYAIFPMPVRMWIEKVGELTSKIQDLFVDTKMPQYIESESIIGATIMQALEQQDSVIKQAMLSGKINKFPFSKSSKFHSSASNNHDKAERIRSIETNADTHFLQSFADSSRRYTHPANNSFIIPVFGSSSSTLKASNQTTQSEDEFRPSFFSSPLEPFFIPFPQNDHVRSQTKSIPDRQNNPDDTVSQYYMNHFSDYGFGHDFGGNQNEIQPSQGNYPIGRFNGEEEEDRSDELFLQLDFLSLDYLPLDNDSDESSDASSVSSISSIRLDDASQFQDELGQPYIFPDQRQNEIDDEQEDVIQKPLQTKGNIPKDRKAAQRKSQENDDWKGTENKRRGRPKKLKPSTDDKEKTPDKDKEKTIDKEKTKTKDKSKEKDKDKTKTKTKTKDKKENEEKSTKAKRAPKELKEKKELKEMKEPKGRKYPKKVSHTRKTKSDLDNISSPPKGSTKTSEDRSQGNEKLTTKKKMQTKRQNRKNLSADEGNDDDFLPPIKPPKNSTSTNLKKRKAKSGPGRHKKFGFDDDDDYQYGQDNEDDNDNDFDPNSVTEESLTDGHLIAFMEAAHQLNGPNDQKEMAAIIHKTEPQITFSGSYPVIDITKLKTITLLALIKYTKKKFKERGKEYPIL